jgi:Kdo2-lipid IVA lauroyltransferase/acyltransferase
MKKLSLSTFLQLKVNTLIFKHFDPRLTYLYISVLGKLYFLFNKKERNAIKQNVGELVTSNDNATVNNVFDGIIKHYYEKLLMAYYDMEKFLSYLRANSEIKGKELLDEALKEGNGVILATAHFGAVEYLPVILAMSKYKVNVACKFKTKDLRDSLRDRAEKMNISLLNCGEESSILFKASGCLRNNEILMTEVDEVDAWNRDDTRTVELFKKKVYLDKGIDILSRRTKARVLAVYVKREKNNKVVVEISDVNNVKIPEENEHRSSFVYRLLNIFQQYVTAYPEQWYEWKKWQLMKAS